MLIFEYYLMLHKEVYHKNLLNNIKYMTNKELHLELEFNITLLKNVESSNILQDLYEKNIHALRSELHAREF